MARRKKDQDARRDEIIRVRMSGAERDRFERGAAIAGRKPADHARDRLLDSQAAPAVVSLPAERHRLAAFVLSEQLRRVGVNLNQWVRHMHETGLPPPAEAEQLLTEIRGLVRQARGL